MEKGNPQKVTFINLSEECSDCIWNLPDKGTFHAFGDQTVEFLGAGGVSGRTSGRECIWMPGYGDYGTSGIDQRIVFPEYFYSA